MTWSLLKDTHDSAALTRFIAQYPRSAARPEAEARIAALAVEAQSIPPPPSPDAVTWGFLKGTNDAAALNHFVEQFPRSAHRAEAEQRIAAIVAEQAAAARAVEQRMAALAAEAQAAKARPAGPSPEDIAWSLVKDSKDPNQFRLFLNRFPESGHKAEAEQRVAALATDQRSATLRSSSGSRN